MCMLLHFSFLWLSTFLCIISLKKSIYIWTITFITDYWPRYDSGWKMCVFTPTVETLLTGFQAIDKIIVCCFDSLGLHFTAPTGIHSTLIQSVVIMWFCKCFNVESFKQHYQENFLYKSKSWFYTCPMYLLSLSTK